MEYIYICKLSSLDGFYLVKAQTENNSILTTIKDGSNQMEVEVISCIFKHCLMLSRRKLLLLWRLLIKMMESTSEHDFLRIWRIQRSPTSYLKNSFQYWRMQVLQYSPILHNIVDVPKTGIYHFHILIMDTMGKERGHFFMATEWRLTRIYNN